jgi:multidrug efflux pump subunit AcrA (membrane-fusion protein)
MKRKRVIGLVLLFLVFLPAGCSGAAQETSTPEPMTDFVPVVSVTGEVVPETWATLSAQAGGPVEEIVVVQGGRVEAGELLIQLDDTDARLAVQRAQAALEAAQARLALLEAGPRSGEIAVAEAQVEAARAGVSQAAAQRDRLQSGATEAEIAAAEAQVAAAQAEQLAAREAHDQSMRCYDAPDGSPICPGLGPVEEQARFRLHAAEEALAAAQAQLDAAVSGSGTQVRAAEAAVWAAAAQRDVAQAQLDLLQAGATAEERAVAEASVAQADAALQAARVALERSAIRAPFAGTVGEVHVRAGELVAPGQPLVTLGDLSTLQVRTTDLDEIDVARVEAGQPAVVTFDGLPERTFAGHVVRVSPMAAAGGGGVHYTAVIELEELDPAVRWGMTAFVDIEVEE